MNQLSEKIDFSRGIAIMLVFFFHSQLILLPEIMSSPNPFVHLGTIKFNTLHDVFLFLSPTSFGWAGVELFLIISGFLIHLGYLKQENNFSINTFFSKRFWRIYPPYFIVCIFLMVSTEYAKTYFATHDGIIHSISHFFLIHNFSDFTIYSVNGSYWSLALEAQLYLIYPIFLFIRKKIGIHRSILIIVGISILFTFLGYLFPAIPQPTAYDKSLLRFWFIWTLGAYVAECYMNNKKAMPINNIAILFALYITSAVSIIFPASRYFGIYFISLTMLSLFELILYNEKVNFKSKFFKPAISIGICSYSIYLIHQPFLESLFKYFFTYNHVEHSYFKVIKAIPAFIVLYMISYAMHQMIEQPFIKLGENFRTRRRSNSKAINNEIAFTAKKQTVK